jgi:hypothetical protein
MKSGEGKFLNIRRKNKSSKTKKTKKSSNPLIVEYPQEFPQLVSLIKL